MAGTDTAIGVEGQNHQWFGSEVTKRTNGRVTFRYAWAGAMTKGGQDARFGKVRSVRDRQCARGALCG